MRTILCAAIATFAAVVPPISAGEPLRAAAIEALLQEKSLGQLLEDPAPLRLASGEAPAVRKMLWQKYAEEQRKDPVRLEEHRQKRLRFGEAVMRYEVHTIGDKPPAGYPLYIALHGGGGGPAAMNDGQWRHMQVYYAGCVTNGLYVAPRGVANTWNLHFRGESDPLYDRLIENMVLFKGANPNRVYLLGYSAGGDGVYQVVPRMADRFAAADMSAGHHNGTSPRNLYRVPFLLQVGERDGAYKRNHATVDFAAKLRDLRVKTPDGYVYELFVHAGRPHNFRDNDPKGGTYPVLENPFEWRDGAAPKAVPRNTSAVAWLSEHRRDFRPKRVVWDLKTRAGTRAGEGLWSNAARAQQFYWMDVGTNTVETLGTNEVIARFEKDSNAVVIEKPARYLRILADSAMLDLTRPVTVRLENHSRTLILRPNARTMAQTLADRGDPFFVFEAAIIVEKDGGEWSIREDSDGNPAGRR
jgi:hypothetical protein